MGFVQNDSAESPFQQESPFVRRMENQSGGNNGDAERASGNVLGTTSLDGVTVGIHPHFLTRRLDGTGDAQAVVQLDLPLESERRGTQNKNRAVIKKDGIDRNA